MVPLTATGVRADVCKTIRSRWIPEASSARGPVAREFLRYSWKIQPLRDHCRSWIIAVDLGSRGGGRRETRVHGRRVDDHGRDRRPSGGDRVTELRQVPVPLEAVRGEGKSKSDVHG